MTQWAMELLKSFLSPKITAANAGKTFLGLQGQLSHKAGLSRARRGYYSRLSRQCTTLLMETHMTFFMFAENHVNDDFNIA